MLIPYLRNEHDLQHKNNYFQMYLVQLNVSRMRELVWEGLVTGARGGDPGVCGDSRKSVRSSVSSQSVRENHMRLKTGMIPRKTRLYD